MKGKLIRPALLGSGDRRSALVVGGIAYATIPDAGGVIHGCYQKTHQGTLRVIDTGKAQTCSKLRDPARPGARPGRRGSRGRRASEAVRATDSGPSGSSHAYSDTNDAWQTG